VESSVEIEISGARYLAIIGARSEERNRLQPIELSLRINLDPGESLLTDSLADTLSYSALLKEAAAVLVEGRFHLVEAAANSIAVALLEHAAIQSVVVTVSKLRPPVESDLRSVAAIVTMTR
jgi:dihydroneopterin aldolase